MYGGQLQTVGLDDDVNAMKGGPCDTTNAAAGNKLGQTSYPKSRHLLQFFFCWL